jgi:hypothetical protein
VPEDGLARAYLLPFIFVLLAIESLVLRLLVLVVVDKSLRLLLYWWLYLV